MRNMKSKGEMLEQNQVDGKNVQQEHGWTCLNSPRNEIRRCCNFKFLAAQVNTLNRHRITESLRWEKLSMILKSSCSASSAKATANPSPQVPYLLNPSRNGASTIALGSLCWCWTTTFGEKSFPDIKFKAPVAHLDPVFSCPITYSLREETNTHTGQREMWQTSVGGEAIQNP